MDQTLKLTETVKRVIFNIFSSFGNDLGSNGFAWFCHLVVKQSVVHHGSNLLINLNVTYEPSCKSHNLSS